MCVTSLTGSLCLAVRERNELPIYFENCEWPEEEEKGEKECDSLSVQGSFFVLGQHTRREQMVVVVVYVHLGNYLAGAQSYPRSKRG